MDDQVHRALIVGRIRPGTEQAVADAFRESDRGPLPQLIGVRHRSLFSLGDVYAHLVETTRPLDEVMPQVRDDPLFVDVSRALDPYIKPFDPDTWRSPTDAMAREFYTWDPEPATALNLRLAGKHAVVTGGTRGIGRATVLALAQQGVSVAAVGRTESAAAESLRGELESFETDSFVASADVADEGQVGELADQVGEQFGSVDLIVNNAGTVAHTTLAETTLAEWQRMMDVNVTSMYLVTRALLDAVADGGSIVNVGSGIALRGLAGRTHYTAAKAAAIGLTRALAHELGPRGIRVNVVAPGITDTGAEIPPERRLQYEQRTPLRRIATPQDIANAVLFLACDLSGFVTGQVIEVNGGI